MPEAAGTDGDAPKDTVRVRPPQEVISLMGIAPQEKDNWRRKKQENIENGLGNRRGPRKGSGKGKGKDEEPAMLTDPDKGMSSANIQKFVRDDKLTGRMKAPGDKKLNGQLKRGHKKDRDALFMLAKSEILQTEDSGFLQPEGRERTIKVSQGQILENAPVAVAKKKFAFNVPYGPYSCAFTSNGTHLLAAGRAGHVALMECDTMQIAGELQLKETVRAVQPLHNQLMFAVAQKKYVYIYDNMGVELHCIKDHRYPIHMDFLPYHFLLVSACQFSDLHYRDISTGAEVCVHKTKLGAAGCMRQNPKNAVVHVGHNNGTVTMWTPTVKAPVVKLWTHAGNVNSIAIHDNYMATAGADGFWKVWDLRKYEPLHTYKSFGHAVSDIDISMTGLVSVGFGAHLEVWKDVLDGPRPIRPYLSQEFRGKIISSVKFRPYEDVCAVGHSSGFESLLIPGAGHANFDSFEANPYETKKERREKEVRRLLEKLQPDSIMLNPHRIGSIDRKIVKELEDDLKLKHEEEEKNKDLKKRARGKNKVGNIKKRKELRKGKLLRDSIKKRIEGEDGSDDGSDEEGGGASGEDAEGAGGPGTSGAGAKDAEAPAVGGALGRFYGKRRRKT